MLHAVVVLGHLLAPIGDAEAVGQALDELAALQLRSLAELRQQLRPPSGLACQRELGPLDEALGRRAGIGV